MKQDPASRRAGRDTQAVGLTAVSPPSERSSEQRADRLTPAHCKGLVDPM